MKALITALLLALAVTVVPTAYADDHDYTCTTSGAYGQEETCVPKEKDDEDRQVVRKHDITDVNTSLTREQWIFLTLIMLSGAAGAYSIKTQLSQ